MEKKPSGMTARPGGNDPGAKRRQNAGGSSRSGSGKPRRPEGIKPRRPVPSPGMGSAAPRQEKKQGETVRKTAKPAERSAMRLEKRKRPRRLTRSETDRAAEKVLEKPRVKKEKEKPVDIKPLAPPKEPISPRMRKIRLALIAAATAVVLLAVCTALSFTVFFKIDEIKVEGKTRYKTDDIIASSMIQTGDNLLLCNTSPGEEKIKADFSYIEEVHVKKKLFNKIIINVSEAKPSSIIESGGQFIVISKLGKILEIDKEKKFDVPTVLGAKLKNVKEGGRIEFIDPNLRKHLEALISGIDEVGLEGITTVDMSDTSRVTLITEKDFKIILGTFENIDYKLRTAAGILIENSIDNKTGTLDVSLASSDGGKSYLKLINAEPKPETSTQTSKPAEESTVTEENKPEPVEEPEEVTEPEDDWTYEPEESEETYDDDTGWDDQEDYTGDDGTDDENQGEYEDEEESSEEYGSEYEQDDNGGWEDEDLSGGYENEEDYGYGEDDYGSEYD